MPQSNALSAHVLGKMLGETSMGSHAPELQERLPDLIKIFGERDRSSDSPTLWMTDHFRLSEFLDSGGHIHCVVDCKTGRVLGAALVQHSFSLLQEIFPIQSFRLSLTAPAEQCTLIAKKLLQSIVSKTAEEAQRRHRAITLVHCFRLRAHGGIGAALEEAGFHAMDREGMVLWSTLIYADTRALDLLTTA